MDVVEFIRQYLKTRIDIADDQLWSEIQAIAQSLSIDLNHIDEAYAQLIAEEVDKNGHLAITGGIAPVAEKNIGKGSSASDSDSIERLKPAVKNLQSVISGQTQELKRIVKNKVAQVEDSIVDDLIQLTDGMNANIVNKFASKLEGRVEETQSFLNEFEGVFNEAFSGF